MHSISFLSMGTAFPRVLLEMTPAKSWKDAPSDDSDDDDTPNLLAGECDMWLTGGAGGAADIC